VSEPIPLAAAPARVAPFANLREAETVAPVTTISFLALLNTMRRNALLVALAAVVAIGVAALALAWIPPRYRAEAVLVVKLPQNALPTEGNVAPRPSELTDAEVTSVVDAISSVPVLDDVVSKLHLEQDPEFNSSLRVARLEPDNKGAFGRLGAALRGAIVAVHGFLSPAAFKDPRLETVASLAGALKVFVKGTSRSISVQAMAREPGKAASIANAVTDAAVRRDLAEKTDATSQLEAWLGNRLSELKQRVSQSEEELERLRTSTGRFEGQTAAIVSEQLSQISKQLLETRAQLAAAQAKRSEITRLRAEPDGLARAGEVLASPAVQSLRAQESRLSADLAASESKFGPRHPSVRSLRSQLSAISVRLAAETKRIVHNEADRIRLLTLQTAELERAQGELESRIETQRASSGRLKELQRDVDGDRATYQGFAIFRAKMGGLPQIERANLQVVSPAVPSLSPAWPNRKAVLLLTGLGTLGLGFVASVLRVSLDQGLRNADQIGALLGLETAALVPLVPKRQRGRRDPARFALDVPGCALHESVRHLYTAVEAVRAGRPHYKVLISSALPGEGKSTTSVMLAREAALVGVKTLLVCLDLRRAMQKPEGETAEHLTITTEAESGLSVLTVRIPQHRSFRALYLRSFWEKLQSACQDHELIIIDSPPILSVSDAKIIARIADMTILVVKWGSTKVAEASEALRQLRAIGSEAHWAVLTQVDPRRRATYGDGGSGFYVRQHRKYVTGLRDDSF
jgi:polysaccharide biosynthesis transport protein